MAVTTLDLGPASAARWTCVAMLSLMNVESDSVVDQSESYGDDPRNGCPVWRLVRDGLSVDIPSAPVWETLAARAGVTLTGARPGVHIVVMDYDTVMAATVGASVHVTWADGRPAVEIDVTPAELWDMFIGLAETAIR